MAKMEHRISPSPQRCRSRQNPKLDVGVVQIKDDLKNRGVWKIGVVVDWLNIYSLNSSCGLVKHSDVILGAKLEMGKTKS